MTEMGTRVDMAMSDLSSAIHNTGHYHVRPRPVLLVAVLRPDLQTTGAAYVLASVDLANLTHVRPPKRLQRTCAESATG